MERLLHYVWKYRLYPESSFRTLAGQWIVVVDPGVQNPHTGPDFFNAKIKIDNAVWVGNIEIHTHASDWTRHGHHLERIYDSVVLHIVEDSDCLVYRTNGELIPQIVLRVPASVKQNYSFLLESEREVACIERLSQVEPMLLLSWMAALLGERLERKTQDIFGLLNRHAGDWNEVLYIILTRNFGFGTNSDAFERLARSLPFRYIQKHRNNSTQVEALLFGQAGMLQDPDNKDSYYQALRSEYLFLKHKFDLFPMDSVTCRNQHVRPAFFPCLKLAQLSALWVKHDLFFSKILEARTVHALRELFAVAPSPYWETHYHFQFASVKKQKILSLSSLNILLINTVVPMLFSYGVKHRLPEFTEKALSILESLPAENNRIVSTFRSAGMLVKHAGDSQSLIQLKRVYCEHKKCLYCRIGFKLLQKK